MEGKQPNLLRRADCSNARFQLLPSAQSIPNLLRVHGLAASRCKLMPLEAREQSQDPQHSAGSELVRWMEGCILTPLTPPMGNEQR